jgi:hypothetical protein
MSVCRHGRRRKGPGRTNTHSSNRSCPPHPARTRSPPLPARGALRASSSQTSSICEAGSRSWRRASAVAPYDSSSRARSSAAAPCASSPSLRSSPATALPPQATTPPPQPRLHGIRRSPASTPPPRHQRYHQPHPTAQPSAPPPPSSSPSRPTPPPSSAPARSTPPPRPSPLLLRETLFVDVVAVRCCNRREKKNKN